jgi:hypothetical protein
VVRAAVDLLVAEAGVAAVRVAEVVPVAVVLRPACSAEGVPASTT